MNSAEAAALAAEASLAAAKQRRRDRIEDIAFLINDGVHPPKVAERLGVSVAALARQMYRAGELDLAAVFERHTVKNRARGVCRFCHGPTSRTYRSACAACRPLAQTESINARRAS